MEETKKKATEICELRGKLVCGAMEAFSKGIQSVNSREMGEVTDMIKDLAEAEEKIWKACYYKQIVTAMKEEEEREELMAKMGMTGEMGEGRMGYDHYRYDSGRFAPKGRGHYSAGYTPMHMEGDMEPMMMGYSDGSSGSHRNDPGPMRSGMGGANRMGYTGSERGHRYDRYAKARMGYHESKDAASKEHMDTSAREYVVDTAESIREIWKDADPAMRKELKSKLSNLVAEMN